MGYWESFYHLIWTTKNREPFIDDVREELLLKSFRATAQEKNSIVRAIGMVSEHVHIAISIPPVESVSYVVRDLKTAATHLINHAAPLSDGGIFTWQREFAMFTFGAKSLDDVVEYVENQKLHHQIGTIRPRFERLDRLERSE
jgi:REP element-mobilizing transposase RayT